MARTRGRRGTIVFLNGTSSAGKSAIATAFQEVMDAPYIHIGIDHLLARVPGRLHVQSDGVDPATSDGFLWVLPDGETVTEVRIGPIGLRLWAGLYRAVVGLATAGNDVIIDDVVFDPRVLRAAVEALYRFSVLFVGVQCPLDVAQRRERARGDRMHGLALAQYARVHAHGVYDLELDSAVLSPQESALQIKAFLDAGYPRTALMQLKQRQ